MERFRVLYTTRITQKEKKWQDGFLDLSSTASDPKTYLVKLYDEEKSILCTKPFIGHNPVSLDGEHFRVEGYLVHIDSVDTIPIPHLPQIEKESNEIPKPKTVRNAKNFRPPSSKSISSPTLSIIKSPPRVTTQAKPEKEKVHTIILEDRGKHRTYNEILQFFTNTSKVMNEISTVKSNLKSLT